MISVILTGTGNVATHLFKACYNCDEIEVKQVFNHREDSLKYFADYTATTTSIEEVKDADFYLVAVSDNFTQSSCEKLKNKPGIVAHTSGSQALPEQDNSGVFYPLQTFSKSKDVNFQEIPLCIEGRSAEAADQLLKLGQLLSQNARLLSGQQRQKLHLAAVFACNFSNHMMSLSEEICRENDIAFSLLQKLILETAQKAVQNAPAQVQTGPAIRGDRETLKAHEEALRDKPNELEIYKLLSQSIKNHGNKL